MRILAIETATSACSIAVQRDERIFQDHRIVPRQHNRLVLRMIQGVLTTASLRVADLDLIAISRGPGSFTGLRIGASVAQGLAAPGRTPLIGVSTLEILANSGLARQKGRAAEGAVAVLKSRPGEIYLGAYRRHGEAVIEDGVIALSDVVIPGECRNWLLVGEVSETVAGSPALNKLAALPCEPMAGTLVELASQRFGETGDLVSLGTDLFYPRGDTVWKKSS